MTVNRRGVIPNFSTVYQAIGGSIKDLESTINYISAKAFKHAIRKRRIMKNIILLGLI